MYLPQNTHLGGRNPQICQKTLNIPNSMYKARLKIVSLLKVIVEGEGSYGAPLHPVYFVRLIP